MQKILFLISTMITSPKDFSPAVEKAVQEDAELVICFVTSNRVPDSVSSWLIYIGFMGDKPTGELRSAISDHYRQRVQEQLSEIEHVATQKGIRCRSLLYEGDMVSVGERIAREEQIDLIMVNEPHRSDFDHPIFLPARDELAERVDCPVMVAEDVHN